VRISIPHNNRAVDTFTAYPYVSKPPRVSDWPAPLPTKEKQLRRLVFNTGYSNRVVNKAYPPGGWRWEYCWKAAVRRSGESTPRTLFAAESWAKGILVHLRPEVERMNAGEEQRKERYQALAEEFETQGVEMESEATRNGLTPVELRLRRGAGQVRLEPGNWWITGTRKVPGLLYYWQLPVTVTTGDTSSAVLTEQNALVIQGAW
jgi:hypothetical protein